MWKEIGQKDQQRSTKHTHKTKYRVTLTPLKTVDGRRCSGIMVSIFYNFKLQCSDQLIQTFFVMILKNIQFFFKIRQLIGNKFK
jgi:hypothetical protein